MIRDLRPEDPASVGPYRLLGRLGAGGMGQVYLGKSPGGRLVAIKLIRPELAEERGFRARFASEISAATHVSGIYTAAVVDADADAALPWMATVYVEGPSLTDAVEENGPLPVTSVLALAGGLAEALAAIHRADLVHRDLKPSNVLLAADGPRVIDFGISMALERSMLTTTGMVMGSPGFMSPEQARGQREVGAPTDVFSLGAVLAYAATGSNPFGSGPTPALLYRVVNEVPDLGAVPSRLSPLVGQCLEKNPADRPTPGEILALLGDDVGVLSGEWLPPSVTQTMARYTPTRHTPLPPSAGGPGRPQAVPGAPGPAALEPVPVTAVDQRLFPETAVALGSGGFTTAGRGIPGGLGGPPPRRQSALRRWRWPVTAAAAAVAVAVVAVLLTSHSHGGGPKVNPTASLAGDATKAPATKAGSATPSATPTPTTQSASAKATTAPPTQASPTATQTQSASPTKTSTPTQTATSTPTHSTSSSPTAAPTTAAPTTQAPTTQAPTTQAPTTPPGTPTSTAPTSSAPTSSASGSAPSGSASP